MDSTDLQEYVGRYYCDDVDNFITIIFDEGDLKMPDTNAPGLLPVTPISADHLQLGPGKAEFSRNNEGVLSGFAFNLDGGRVSGLYYEKLTD